ncbi:unnamed protein product [Vicia faba]|uniref:Leucine-rich repeat-containing N-terminal plant-type domain-containing protein n=1 Tax=Vicia faba TaxID=3906 RepID=A0AAV0YQV1_VICFA|nr:unnamed protein product [Vicia faba]
MGWFLMWLHLFLIHFPSFSSSSSSFNFLCHHDESSALLQFTCPFLQVESSSFLNSYPYFCDEYLAKTKTWINGTDCCSWVGVTCDTISGHVIGLNLGCEGLEGVIYPNSTLFHLSHLQILNLSSNSLSAYIFYFKFDEFPSLTYLDLTYCDFIGEIPSQISHLSKLTSLRLSENNELSWKETTLKRLMQNATNLKELFLDGTNMHSVRPNSIDFLFNHSSSLSTLNLGNTGLRRNFKKRILCLPSIQELYLSGPIPQCVANFPYLQVLDLQVNKFHGTLPSKFSQYCQLHELNLNDNQLEGHLPKSLSQCEYLEVLNLGNNKIEDNFPDWLQTLQQLNVLVLRDNKLNGLISNIKFKHPFPRLMIFDISGNNFSGLLPTTYLRSFQGRMIDPQGGDNSNLQYMDMQLLNSTLFYDSVSVRIKGINSTLVKISRNFATIDMSRNKFEGDIPDVVGEFHALIGLNLSHNSLTGIIPRSMGNMTTLESLDLSSNILSGVIPAELSNLNFLEFLDLSNNHLVGDIPQGKQFNTFSNDSYEGNSGLCGLPLSKKCGPEQQSPPSPDKLWSEEKFGFGWKPVAIGYGCGFVFGIGLGYCMFLFGKPRWLVMIFGGQPKRRVKRRTRVRMTNGSTMDQMIQMS